MPKKAKGSEKKNESGLPKSAPKKVRRNYNVSAEAFALTWQSSETAQDVADRLDMPKPIVQARASMYRQMGVKLKKLRRSSKNDINAINRTIEEINQVGDEDSMDQKTLENVLSHIEEMEGVAVEIARHAVQNTTTMDAILELVRCQGVEEGIRRVRQDIQKLLERRE